MPPAHPFARIEYSVLNYGRFSSFVLLATPWRVALSRDKLVAATDWHRAEPHLP
jgi:hypothetical protein